MRRLVAAALVLALPGCTVGIRRSHPATPPRHSPPVAVAPPDCGTTYGQPDPHRPRITLTFSGGDRGDDPAREYGGTEHVVFTPDAPITEVVFRLWPNNPLSRKHGGSLVVTEASLPMRTEALGGTDELPTLVALRLPKESPAGRPVTVDLEFVLTVPEASVDRWGDVNQVVTWWGSGHPMLAWVRGSGWQTEPAVGMLGETAATEAADYDVTVDAPGNYTVLGGDLVTVDARPIGQRRWHFRAPLARDVAVVIGRFATRRETVDGVPVLVAVALDSIDPDAGDEADAQPLLGAIVDGTTAALHDYVGRFGPYPYRVLTVVSIAQIESAGVEYPGIVFVGNDGLTKAVPHELAHQWFYGLVGDDQARDPWLDEAFATYAQALVTGDEDRFLDAADRGGDVGRPMAYWDKHRADYGRVVYGKGAGALLAAREAAGPEVFDKLLRCYVARQAYRVASPVDVVNAFSTVPEAVEVLRDAGAVPS